MQLKEALRSAVARLTESSIGSPVMNAEMLMMFTLGCDRAYLYAHPERELTSEEKSRYAEAITERAAGKPAQYITGHQEFWGLDLLVSPDVLIPRPETEHVVETVLEVAQALQQPSPRIVDVGTGSGCIALALAKELASAGIAAVDISPAALELACANAVRLQLENRIQFYESDLLSGVDAGERFDLVVSNPPYVGESQAQEVEAQVRNFEPRVAVFAGASGIEVYRRLIPQAREVLDDGGWLVVEIGEGMEVAARKLLEGWREVRVTNDLRWIPRVVAARK